MHPSQWLNYYGSLTEEMQQASSAPIRVKVLRQGTYPIFDDERATLDLPTQRWAWIREVQLLGNNRPWLLARTVIPMTTLKGRANRLKLLGSKPLGPVLFNRLGAERVSIAFEQVHEIAWQPNSSIDALWCRQSIFKIDQEPLLLKEIFLPENPVYQKNENK